MGKNTAKYFIVYSLSSCSCLFFSLLLGMYFVYYAAKPNSINAIALETIQPRLASAVTPMKTIAILMMTRIVVKYRFILNDLLCNAMFDVMQSTMTSQS